MTNTKKERIRVEVRTTEEEKEFLKNKAEKLGYKSLTAFLLSAADNHFVVDLNLSGYNKVSREISYIGKNINSLIRRINTDKIYTQSDVMILSELLEQIIKKMNVDYKKMLKFSQKNRSDKMSIKDKQELLQMLMPDNVRVPRKFLLKDILDSIKDDMLYLHEAISQSLDLDEGFSDYLWQYLYGRTLSEIENDKLVDLADKIYIFTEKMKYKLINHDIYFDEDDWDELKEILDEYEIY